ncbi:hypothetical protein [Halomonas sp. I5-271120]|uniref:hypothetical protein n=1 Tax=Halomonas sp. I5-271120 TaxID=3061632 RepID=UPI002714BA0C|nr:hypothetical protein [Halomonas sp. I5-271120]
MFSKLAPTEHGDNTAGEDRQADALEATTAVTAKPICRISNFTGLAHRRVPVDMAVIPKGLISWATGAAKPRQRSSTLAPALYLVPSEQGTRVVGADHSDPSLYAKASRRLVLADKTSPQPGSGPGQPQSLLAPRQLMALGHLLTGIKYPAWGIDIETHHADERRAEIHLQPAALVRERLGYRICGSAYAQLESDLAGLARTWVKLEERDRDSQEWRTLRSEPLLQHLDTGRVVIENGHDITPSVADGTLPRRHREWRLALGHGLAALLRTQSSDLSVVSPTIWRAAQRSPMAQWLALYLSGSGLDGQHIHPHRLATLVEKMRLCPDDSHQELAKAGMLSAIGASQGASDQAGHWQPSNAPAPVVTKKAKEQRRVNKQKRKQAAQRLRHAIHRAAVASHRLQQRAGLALARILHADQPSDIPPSQAGKRLSRFDLVEFRRWPLAFERLLPELPSWARGHDVLSIVRPILDRVKLHALPDMLEQSCRDLVAFLKTARPTTPFQARHTLRTWLGLAELKWGAGIRHMLRIVERPERRWPLSF